MYFTMKCVKKWCEKKAKIHI